MNLHHIGALCNKKGAAVIVTAPDGYTWVSDGVAIYRAKGINTNNARQFLNLNESLPVREAGYKGFERLLENPLNTMERASLAIEVFGLVRKLNTLLFYENGEGQVMAIDKKYLKPLGKDNVTFHISERVDVHGAFLAAEPGSEEVVAVILPIRDMGLKGDVRRISQRWYENEKD